VIDKNCIECPYKKQIERHEKILEHVINYINVKAEQPFSGLSPVSLGAEKIPALDSWRTWNPGADSAFTEALKKHDGKVIPVYKGPAEPGKERPVVGTAVIDGKKGVFKIILDRDAPFDEIEDCLLALDTLSRYGTEDEQDEYKRVIENIKKRFKK